MLQYERFSEDLSWDNQLLKGRQNTKTLTFVNEYKDIACVLNTYLVTTFKYNKVLRNEVLLSSMVK